MRIVRVVKGREARLLCERPPKRAVLCLPHKSGLAGGEQCALECDGCEVVIPGHVTARAAAPCETFGCCDCGLDIDGEACLVQVLADPLNPEE